MMRNAAAFLFVLVLLATVPAASGGEAALPKGDPLRDLEGGWVTAIELDRELDKQDGKNLEFALKDVWKEPLDRALRKEFVQEEVLPPARAEDETPGATPGRPENVEKPVHLRVVLTRASTEAKDRSELESLPTYVLVQIAARLEYRVPGEELPRASDQVEDSFQVETAHALSADLYAEAFEGAFRRLAVRAVGQVTRRLRPERYEERQESPFAPFKPFRRR